MSEWAGVQGKRVLITGASRGIGRAIAVRLAGAGDQVVGFGRDFEQLRRTGEMIESSGGRYAARTVDVTDAAAVSAAMAEVGMDERALAGRLEDPGLWDEVLADHLAAVARCQAFGVPTLILDGGEGPGAFGPVITRVPNDEEARELLSDTVRMIRRDYVFEMKRDREGHPPELAATA